MLDQLGDGVDAVADDLGRLAAGGRHHASRPRPAADSRARGRTARPTTACGFPCAPPRRRPAPVRGWSRFVATPRPWLPSCGLTTTGRPISSAAAQASSASVDRPSLGHRHAHRLQQHAGQFLVLGDLFGDGAGAIGLGGQDPPLPRRRSPTAPGCRHSAGGRECRRAAAASTIARVLGPRQTSSAKLAQAGELGRSRRRAGRRWPPGAARGPVARHSSRQRLLFVFDDDLVDALFGSLAGPAEADVDPGQGLQFRA